MRVDAYETIDLGAYFKLLSNVFYIFLVEKIN